MTELSKAVERLREAAATNFDGDAPHQMVCDVLDLIAFYDAMKWMPIEEAPKGAMVLVYYKNALGKSRIVKAFYAQKHTLECDEDFADYDEDADQYYAPEGWYEDIDNWDEFSSIRITCGEPTHFIPLSSIPLPE